MARQREHEIDRQLAATALEYLDEEHAVAQEEAHEAATSMVFSVRLPPATYEAVRAAAARVHLTPSALIRQWVTERVEATSDDDMAMLLDALRRTVERLQAVDLARRTA